MAADPLHRHLGRQLRKLGLSLTVAPSAEAWSSFLQSVGRTYHDADLERYTLERSVGLFEREMKDLAARLEQERDRMHLILEMAPIGILRTDLDGTISLANPAIRRLLGYDEQELEGRNAAELMAHDDRLPVMALLDDMANGRRPGTYTTERRLLHKSGVIVHTHLAAAVGIESGGGSPFAIVIIEDISERLRLELDLRQAQKLESVGRLASGIAHEINTPIQFIGDNTHFVQSAYGDLMKLCETYRAVLESIGDDRLPVELRRAWVEAEERADLAYLKENVVPAIAATLEGVARVSTIVKAMKSFAHPDRLEKSAADVNMALRNTLTVVNNELKYVANVETSFALLPDVPCYLNELNQVFLNLLINAAHAIGDVKKRLESTSPAEGELYKGTIGIRTFLEPEAVVVAVTDSGTGIPEAIRTHIFDPFFTTKEVGRGSGQGLAISRAVVERHGGTLTFETEVGKGTTFFVRLPISAPG